MRLALFVAISLLTSSVTAHEVRPAFLKITELSGDAASSSFGASFRQPQVDGRFLGLTVETNCAAAEIGASVTEGALIEVSELRCGEDGLNQILILGLDRTLIDALVSISWLDGTTTNRLITAQAGSLDLSSAVPAVPVYLSVGVKHLLLGYDHILFVLMLLYLVRKPTAIILVISSFTLANSASWLS